MNLPDANQALKDAENSLRDFFAAMLEQKYGKDWVDQCGAPAERIEKWNERREIERRRQQHSSAIDERLIYYADFYDLSTLLRKNWELFKDALGELRTMEVWLGELGKLRDPEAHRRELMPHQKYLAMGIAGEIRTRIVRYRSKMETSNDYYPRIEIVRDNFGNSRTLDNTSDQTYTDTTKLRVGDLVEYTVTATDPLGEPLEFFLSGDNQDYELIDYGKPQWLRSSSHILSFTVKEKHIKRQLKVFVNIISNRPYHAHGDCDDFRLFTYEVFPPGVGY